MKEKFTVIETISNVTIQENKVISFNKKNNTAYSFRVLKDGYLGVHYQQGEMSDEEGYKRAEQNLELKRPYKFDLETGVRHRDKTEKMLTDKQLLDLAKEAVEHMHAKYPDFKLNGSFEQVRALNRQENDKGLNYSNIECTTNANFSFKHKDSKHISDGWFGMGHRSFELNKLYDMADNYLSNYQTEVEFPEEIIIQMQYYSLLGKLREHLDAEKICLGTSLLSGKVGKKVFAEHFHLSHDVSDEECWHNNFFDGEGVIVENDRVTLIENGVILRGYADKKISDKYNVEHTGSAWRTFSDILSNGNVNLRISRSSQTIKELLNGRFSIVPVQYSGGGFNDKGEYTMPIQLAYLCDGEKFIGKLPEFTLVNNMFDMFGNDFIGVGSDNPVFNDKQILVKMKLGKTANNE